MIYVYFFINCVVKWSENSVRFEKSYGSWLPDGSDSVILSMHHVINISALLRRGGGDILCMFIFQNYLNHTIHMSLENDHSLPFVCFVLRFYSQVNTIKVKPVSS